MLAALARLAAHDVAALPGLTVVGVTGSSGKTSTKDLSPPSSPPARPDRRAARVVQQRARPALHGAARRRRATRYLVLELSARGLGHIAALARIAPPRIGVVLNVGSRAPRRVRLGRRDRRGQGRAGRGAAAAATAASPCSTPTTRWSPRWPRAPGARVVHRRRGRRRASPRRRRRRWTTRPRPRSRWSTPRGHGAGGAAAGRRAPGRQRAGRRGRRARLRAAARRGRRRAVGGRARVAAGGWRSPSAPDGVTVINDAYNANPESMRAALQALSTIGRAGGGPGRCSARWPSWAGRDAAHDAIGRLVVRLGIDRLIVVGAGAGRACRRPRGGLRRTESCACRRRRAPLDAAARHELAPGDVVLVKASRSAGLERCRAAPLERGEHRLATGDRPGSARVKTILVAAASRSLVSILFTPLPDPALLPAGLRPGDPRGRPAAPQEEARHADHGRHGDHHRDVGRLPGRGRIDGSPAAAGRPRPALLLLYLTTGMGLVGFLDDFIKIRKQRNLGLNKRMKFLGQTFVGARPSAILALPVPQRADDLTPGLDLAVLRPGPRVLSLGASVSSCSPGCWSPRGRTR